MLRRGKEDSAEDGWQGGSEDELDWSVKETETEEMTSLGACEQVI